MNTLNLLTDLHVREAEARLRHVDELISGSLQGSPKGPVHPHRDVPGDRIQADGGRWAVEIDGLRAMSRTDGQEVADRADGVNHALGAIGLELDKALAAVLVTVRR